MLRRTRFGGSACEPASASKRLWPPRGQTRHRILPASGFGVTTRASLQTWFLGLSLGRPWRADVSLKLCPAARKLKMPRSRRQQTFPSYSRPCVNRKPRPQQSRRPIGRPRTEARCAKCPRWQFEGRLCFPTLEEPPAPRAFESFACSVSLALRRRRHTEIRLRHMMHTRAACTFTCEGSPRTYTV